MTGEGTMARAERIELRAQALLLETVGRVLPGGAIDRAADSLRAALALPPDPAPPGPDRYADGWRAGVLAAREYLRQTWDDGDQGSGNDAAELELLRLYAGVAVPELAPAPAATGDVVLDGGCATCGCQRTTHPVQWMTPRGERQECLAWRAPHAGEKEIGT